MIKIALGGIVGVIAAILILWFGFSNDPLGVFSESRSNATAPIAPKSSPPVGPKAPQPPSNATSDELTGRAIAGEGDADDSTVATNRDANLLLAPLEVTESILEETVSTTADERLPAPTGSVLEDARKVVREVFETKYNEVRVLENDARRKATANLVGELLQTASETRDPTQRFAVLQTAMTIANSVADIDQSLVASNILATEYQIDAALIQLNSLARWIEVSSNGAVYLPAERAPLHISLLEHISRLFGDAIKTERFENAVRACDFGVAVAKKQNNSELDNSWVARKALVAGLQTQFQNVQKQLDILRKNPEDDDALRDIGQYYCLSIGEWDKGLPLLAKCSDPILRWLATIDQAEAPTDQIAIADAWWDFSKTASPQPKFWAIRRAKYWYELALPQADGLTAKRIESRLSAAVRAITRDPLGELFSADSQANAPTAHAQVTSRQKPLVSSSDDGLPAADELDLGFDFVLIPQGEFLMGASTDDPDALPDEKPQHRVSIKKAFYLAACETTKGQFEAFVRATNYVTTAESPDDKYGAWGYDSVIRDFQRTEKKAFSWKFTGFTYEKDHPVVNVSWYDAIKFCEWLNERSGGKSRYRLPTEVEWEYACRAGTQLKWLTGDTADTLKNHANIADMTLTEALTAKTHLGHVKTAALWRDGYAFTAPVGHFAPNAFGLYDMDGNVAEWCQDEFQPYQGSSESLAKTPGPSEVVPRCFRGGSWGYDAVGAKCSKRCRFLPSDHWANVGFRVLKEVE